MKKLIVIIALLPLICSAQITTDSSYSIADSIYLPVNSTEMRIMYLSAKSRNDGYSLARLAMVENEKLFLNDIKAGDMLNDAYKIGRVNQNPELLYEIAVYENSVNLMNLKAGDILNEAYYAALYKKNAFLLFKIAVYENDKNLMDAKAGDILYEAYTIALVNKDVSTLFKIATYEQEKDIMKITSEEIRREISRLRF